MGRPPAAGPRRPGLRAGQARADARDLRLVDVRAVGVRQPGARLRQLGGPRDGGHGGPEGAVPVSAAGRRPALRVLDDRAGERRLRSDAPADDRRAAGRRVGHQRPQVVLLQRLGRRLPDRHGRHGPRGAQVPARVDAARPRRHARRDDRARHPDDGAPLRALRPHRRPLGDPLRGRARAQGRAAGCARRRLPDRPAAPRPGPHPPLHALARRLAPRLRHALRALADPLLARLAAVGEADRAELDRRLRRADAGGAADDAARRLEDGHARARRRRARRSR